MVWTESVVPMIIWLLYALTLEVGLVVTVVGRVVVPPLLVGVVVLDAPPVVET